MQRFLARAALSISLLLVPLVGSAQDDLDLDPDAPGTSKKASKRSVRESVVREIERGVYLKTSVGGTFLLGPRSQVLQNGTAMAFTLGMDVIDKAKASLAWEVGFYTAIHNAKFTRAEFFAEDGGVAGYPPEVLIQGDSQVYAGFAGIEGSGYPVRRLGIGGRAGGGIAFVPLLLPRDYYESRVLTAWAAALQTAPASATPAVHEGPMAMIYAGPTLEYYTKLSHFSLGLDVDFIYVIGFDFGLATVGYLKYTF
ncbi:MAG: adventurous gliding motility protein CglE [Alphaproteobacteria bacterium]|nr:adventurous gliding motility protein CglE [Alphaproteobacteria bacterium]